MPENLTGLGLPAWTIAILLLFNLLRPLLVQLLPQVFGFWREKAAAEGELKTSQIDFNRQEDVTIISSMVALQTESIRQNEKLLDFLMTRLDQRIATGFDHVRQGLAEVRMELADMNQRWLLSSKTSDQHKNMLDLMRLELVDLIDKMKQIEQGIVNTTELEFQLANEKRKNTALEAATR